MDREYRNTRRGCFLSNLSMSVAANLSPLLFVTFHTLYGISFTLLGTLVLLNFTTQLSVDLVFTFFPRYFSPSRALRRMPAVVILGLCVYALGPIAFPDLAYLFLCVGTFLFSLCAGLCEVLISPVIAALPSECPDRDMSAMHSVYAWGTAGVVLLSALFLTFFEARLWFVLPLAFTAVPFLAFVFFRMGRIPELAAAERKSGSNGRKLTMILCVLMIFFGGCAENGMTQWCSGFLETATGVPKIVGDTLGTMLFAVLLGLGRSLYAKMGKRIVPVLLLCFGASAAAYLCAAIAGVPALGILACALCGLAVSMLWPGSLIYMASLLPGASVGMYAAMAAGGDLGGALTPQLVGALTDLCAAAGMSEAAGMRVGMGAIALFPLFGIPTVLALEKLRRNKEKTQDGSEK